MRYFPLTYAPLRKSGSYAEYSARRELAPYVRCFWSGNADTENRLVIPDTCMDLIFEASGERVYACFCGADDIPCRAFSPKGNVVFIAVRFYAWTAALFAENSLRGTKNGRFRGEEYFPSLCKLVLSLLRQNRSYDFVFENIEIYLLKALDKAVMNFSLMNAVNDIIISEGRIKISELAMKNALSARSLERLFAAVTGLSPKTAASLIRYQLLWQEMCFSHRFDVLDAVERFGYTDQSHLLHEFKKRHSMTPAQAVELAGINNVAFLQYRSPKIL